MAEALVVAIVGAESTGKTMLAQALAQRLSRQHGLRVAWVPEWLRPWCDEHARTPQRGEQADIAAAQSALIDEAARGHDVVFADTTALMTAVYSRIVFGDDSLDAMAVAAHRRCRLTLLTGLDMPWEPDGLQRDGPHVRPPVDAQLRTLLQTHGFAYSVILGSGAQREDAALQALSFALPALRLRPPGLARPSTPARERRGATAPSGSSAAGCAPG
ncbi:MAG: hypothetical protein ABS84_12435 [Rubrivivax sp. SCN 71-131]|jgi:nicotinamide riboside kinase|nr:MAG: hypothetical protein ABS84_12435 [Rubrivivax sp. SCN 71-131]